MKGFSVMIRGGYLRYSNVGEGLSGKVEVSLDVFADDRLLVVAGNIVPFDSIAVEVVEDGQAGLSVTVLLDLFSVIWLSAWRVESSSEGPVVEAGGRVGGAEPGLVSRPEPSVDSLGEEVGSVTAVEVAKSARSPEVGHVSVDESLDPVVLLGCLEADQVHAALSAVVSGVEPIPLSVPD